MKYLKIIVPIIIVSVAILWGYFQLIENKNTIDEKAQITETIIAEIPVNVVQVQKIAIEDRLELIGTFEARKELNIIAETQGRITNLYIKEGQTISKGQTIATINDAAIRSQLATAKASLAKSEKDVERYSNLLKVGAISQTQYEEVKLGMRNQETNVTSIEQQLQYNKVKAPMSGVVNELLLEEGSFVNPGTEIATIVDINNLKMIVKVDEKDIVKVKKGQLVNMTAEVYPDTKFQGRINQIAVQADESRKYEIAIEMNNNAKTPLKAGMYGTAAIPTGNAKAVEHLYIPRKSVLGSIKNPQVYIARDNKAVLVDIEIGEANGELLVVKSGLKETDVIITTGQFNLENDRAIKIIETVNTLTTTK
ncbi:MAG: efflux RND transporter periplasmic adaptor subunit [Saprospiraceae bacterium]